MPHGPRSPTVLLLVDLQKAFCDADGSMAAQGRDIGAMREAAIRCSGLAREARALDVPVIWTRMAYRPDYLDGGRLVWELRPNLRRIGAMRGDSPDAELSDGVATESVDVVIVKPRYSALYATALEAQLRALGVERVVVGGVTTSMCVETTVRDLSQRDYETHVIGEACADFDAERHRASLAAIAFGFAPVVDLAEGRRLLGAAPLDPQRGDDAIR
jgi:ureidoacrylate peracid hydrolase